MILDPSYCLLDLLQIIWPIYVIGNEMESLLTYWFLALRGMSGGKKRNKIITPVPID